MDASGVFSTSCSTSPREESAPGWNPPAFGLSVLALELPLLPVPAADLSERGCPIAGEDLADV